MNQELIKQIKKLQFIEPDPTFIRKFRSVALPRKTKRRFAWPVWAWSGAFAALVLICATTVAVLSKPREAYSSFDERKINQELDTLNIYIQLDEIKYQQKVHQTINSALSEISEGDAKHLNASVLEKEINEIDVSQKEESKIDELLNQVVF